MTAWINWVIKHSLWVVVGFVLLTALLMTGASRIQLSSDSSVFQPDHHPLVSINQEIRQNFGSSENVIVLLGGDIFAPNTLQQLQTLNQRLEELPNTQRVTSLANLARLEQTEGQIVSRVMLGTPPTASQIAELRSYLQQQSSPLVSADGRYAVLIAEMRAGANPQSFGQAVADTVRKSWSGEVHMAGAPFIIAEVNRTIVNDLQVIGAVALGLILLFLFLNFGRLHGMLLPLVQVFFGLNLGLGLYGFTGAPAGQLTTIGIIAVLAVGSSFALHLLGRFYSELAQGRNKTQALVATFSHTAQGVVISALAIVVAMMTLWFSDIGQLRDVGTLIALGVAGTLASALVLLPALLNLLPAPKIKPQVPNAPVTGGLNRFLLGLARWVFAHRTATFGIAGVLVVFGLIGASRIEANTSFLSFFPKDSPTVKSIQKVDQVFGGSGSLALLLEGDVLQPQALAAMQRFATRAKNEIPGVGQAVSIADTVQTVNALFSGQRQLPQSREQAAQALLVYQSSVSSADLTRQLSLNQQQTLLTLPIPLRNTQETRRYYQQAQSLANEVFAGVLTVKVGGDSLSGLALEDALIHDFILSLSLAILLVVLVDSLVRSFRAAVITISSLLMTIVLQYGLLGWLGIDLDISTMLLGALAIGVGDYAIHLTVRYLEELKRGRTAQTALEQTLLTSGRSIVFTALTLGAGFAALSFSQLQPVASLGQLMVFTVLSVGVSSLSLLPAMSLQFLRPAKAAVPLNPQEEGL